jgi:hypothetical protein
MEGNFWISNVKLLPPGVSDQILCANAVNCLWTRWCVGATKTHHHPKFVSSLLLPGVVRKVDYHAEGWQQNEAAGKSKNTCRGTDPMKDRNREGIKESAVIKCRQHNFYEAWIYQNVHIKTLWSRSFSKWYLRTQSVPQRKHNSSPLQTSTG